MSERNGQKRQHEFRSTLIVDDHPLFCDALSMTLQAVSGIRKVTTADCLKTALEALSSGTRPDLIVLDLNLPDANGLSGLVRLQNASARGGTGSVPVLVVSSMADNRVISSVIHAGAAGFVPKHSQRDVFRNALETIEDGARFIPAGYVLLSETVDDTQHDATSRLASLTNQQARILQLICEGKLNKQIAYDLSIAETTVKAHVTAIMRKLGVQSRTQAVLLATDSGYSRGLQGRS